MITAASIKRDLNGSLAITPSLDKAIAKQREQLRDQMHIADKSRAMLNGQPSPEDWDCWADAASRARDVAKSLAENLETQMQSRAAVPEASDEVLASELVKRAEAGERGARKAILDAAKRIKQPKTEARRGRS